MFKKWAMVTSPGSHLNQVNGIGRIGPGVTRQHVPFIFQVNSGPRVRDRAIGGIEQREQPAAFGEDTDRFSSSISGKAGAGPE